jgi:hypothetical protein
VRDSLRALDPNSPLSDDERIEAAHDLGTALEGKELTPGLARALADRLDGSAEVALNPAVSAEILAVAEEVTAEADDGSDDDTPNLRSDDDDDQPDLTASTVENSRGLSKSRDQDSIVPHRGVPHPEPKEDLVCV